ncbi:hypothetical protein HS088_TW02G00384 [Tripterygium wilfordii]|uniref:Uncharacterized protein n=1 Tax=Tripterygium wilfordii TaxID=458696 RepID=A0A7J7DYN7_TRIWF|nr:hypothetical protein HS088_TW02G00384 [Tripterygium wilfordii]
MGLWWTRWIWSFDLRGQHCLSSTGATKIYINLDIPENNEIIQSYESSSDGKDNIGGSENLFSAKIKEEEPHEYLELSKTKENIEGNESSIVDVTKGDMNKAEHEIEISPKGSGIMVYLIH